MGFKSLNVHWKYEIESRIYCKKNIFIICIYSTKKCAFKMATSVCIYQVKIWPVSGWCIGQ